MLETENVIFMIEDGRALELIKEHIAERKRVAAQVRELAGELGAEQVWTDRETGVLCAVQFSGKIPPGFTRPDRNGASRPKQGTEWAARFKAQKGYANPSETISKELGVPLMINYSGQRKGEDVTGSHCIGFPFTECGFLYLGADGPYAMWVPDVPGEVAKYEAEGYTVKEPAKSFKLEFDGCRRVEREEWDILVMQDRLAKKRTSAAQAA